MCYSVAAATSIDLFVCEVAAHSRFRVEIVAETGLPALPAAAIHNLPAYGLANTLIDLSLSTGLLSSYCDSGANEGGSQHAKRGASNVLSICSSSMATRCVASSVRYSSGNSVSHLYRCQEAACAS